MPSIGFASRTSAFSRCPRGENKDQGDPKMRILDRREFLTASASLAAGLALPAAKAAEAPVSASAKPIMAFHDSLTAKQKKAICFAQDHKGYGGLPLRLHVSNNWAVSGATVASFTKEQ